MAFVLLVGCATSSTPRVSLQAAEARANPAPVIMGTAIAPEPSLLDGVARGTVALASFVDGGVVFIDESADASDGESGYVRETPGTRCGVDLAKILERVKERIAAQLAQPEDQRIECKTTPYATCILGGRAEWDPTMHLVFRNRADGSLVLRAVVLEDEVLVLEEQVAKNREAFSKAIVRLETRC